MNDAMNDAMKGAEKPLVSKEIDAIQERLTDYALSFNYDQLPPPVIHAAKMRVIDTLGALFGGFFAEPSVLSRNLAIPVADGMGSTVIGTGKKTTADLAAFINDTTARSIEMNDSYHWPNSSDGHPSDVILPILGVAEQAGSSGRDFIASVVLAYEVFCRVSNEVHRSGFDATTFACLATAVAAGKLWGLNREQLSHCIAMSVVPNNMLKQARKDSITMFKSSASGHVARAGVFAAQLAKLGMEGPHLPFEGKAGWCNHVAGKRFSLETMGGAATSFKIMDTIIKQRATCGTAMSSVLAAEKIAPLNPDEVERVVVEVYMDAKVRMGTGEHRWNPQTRESADHSVPFNVAVALVEGTVTTASFDDAHVWNPQLRALMQKVEVVARNDFTLAYGKLPVEHHARVIVYTHDGRQLVGATGGGLNDLAAPRSDDEIEKKFRLLSADFLGARRVDAILQRLWRLDEMDNVAAIPPALVQNTAMAGAD